MSWEVSNSEEFYACVENMAADLKQKNLGKIGEAVCPHVIDCNYGEKTVTFKYPVFDWMNNTDGATHMHGGMIALLFDDAMGRLTRGYLGGQAVTPSISLNVSFMNAVFPCEYVIVKTKIEDLKARIIYTRASVYGEDNPNKMLASATGVFYRKTLAPKTSD